MVFFYIIHLTLTETAVSLKCVYGLFLHNTSNFDRDCSIFKVRIWSFFYIIHLTLTETAVSLKCVYGLFFCMHIHKGDPGL